MEIAMWVNDVVKLPPLPFAIYGGADYEYERKRQAQTKGRKEAGH